MALQQSHKSHLHSNWLALIESTLPLAGRSLTRLVICVINQLCQNLELCANFILKKEDFNNFRQMSPNYLITLLKSLSYLCQFCVLDPSSNVQNPPLSQQLHAQSSSNIFTPTNPLQMISNILHVFSNSESSQDISLAGREAASVNDPLLSTKKTVLNHLPRILSSLLLLWKATNTNDSVEWQIMGNAKDVKQNIVSYLSPISLLHGSNFMGAIAVVWNDLKTSRKISGKVLIPTSSVEQNLLVELVAGIRVTPLESVLQTVRQVVKQPPHIASRKKTPIEVSMLQFFLAYIKFFPGSQLLECWKSLLALLKDGLAISNSAMPLAQFHLLAILHEFVQAAPLIEDRKDQKDLQDVAQKLVDACITVAGARLAQTKWLRRGLEVKPGPQADVADEDDSLDSTEVHESKPDNQVSDEEHHNAHLAKYAVQALCALAEVR